MKEQKPKAEQVYNCIFCKKYWASVEPELRPTIKEHGEFMQLYCPTCSVPRDEVRKTRRW